MIVLLLAVLFLSCVIVLTVVLQYRRSVKEYGRLAEALCDPGSWSIRFFIRTIVLSGTVDGHPVQYAVLGNPKAQSLSASYLLALYPIRRNLRVYAESDLSQVDEKIRGELETLQENQGFRSAILTPAESPFLGKLLSRPFGFTYEPGILLCKLEAGTFDAETIRSDIKNLVNLCKKACESPGL